MGIFFEIRTTTKKNFIKKSHNMMNVCAPEWLFIDEGKRDKIIVRHIYMEIELDRQKKIIIII